MPGTIRFRLSPEAQRLLSPILGEKQVAGAVIEQQTYDAISPALQQVLSDCAHDSFDEQSARMARAAAELGGHTTTTPLSAAELMAAARGFRDAADFAGTRLHDPTRETRYRAQAALLDWERLAAPGAEPVVDARRALERNGADAARWLRSSRPRKATEVASVVESLAELMAKEGLSTVPLGLARALMRGGHEAREVGAYLAAAKGNRQLGAARIAVLLLEHLETSGQSLPALDRHAAPAQRRCRPAGVQRDLRGSVAPVHRRRPGRRRVLRGSEGHRRPRRWPRAAWRTPWHRRAGAVAGCGDEARHQLGGRR